MLCGIKHATFVAPDLAGIAAQLGSVKMRPTPDSPTRATTPLSPAGERPHDGEDKAVKTRSTKPNRGYLGGFEDFHRNLPVGPLLVAGVALENRGDPGPELGPLLFGGDAGDHGASRACNRGAYLWVGLEVKIPCRVPVIAPERGHQHQSGRRRRSGPRASSSVPYPTCVRW